MALSFHQVLNSCPAMLVLYWESVEKMSKLQSGIAQHTPNGSN